jgi:hypothetical protein
MPPDYGSLNDRILIRTGAAVKLGKQAIFLAFRPRRRSHSPYHSVIVTGLETLASRAALSPARFAVFYPPSSQHNLTAF